MIPVYQEFPDHDPDNGVIGDCIRAALASILELDLSQVPHFMAMHWPDTATANRAIDQFVVRHGYMLLTLPGKTFMELMEGDDVECFHLIIGYDGVDGLPHAVVGLNGQIVHDPDPDQPGLVGSIYDWNVILLVKTFGETVRRP